MTTVTDPAVPGQAGEEGGVQLHLGIAEQGKVYALEGKHALALAYYRQAIRMTVEAGNHEIFFRHYLECILESLELMGSYGDVLDYCDKAIPLLQGSGQPDHLLAAELAHVYQRQGAVLLKSGERDTAAAAFRKVIDVATRHGLTLPLAKTLLGWLDRGLQVDTRRVEQEQHRLNYFNVRRETVDSARAIKLPNEQLILGVKPI